MDVLVPAAGQIYAVYACLSPFVKGKTPWRKGEEGTSF